VQNKVLANLHKHIPGYIAHENIIIGEAIGEGSFSNVCKVQLLNIVNGEKIWSDAAAKFLIPDSDFDKIFKAEIENLRTISHHQNIIEFYGWSALLGKCCILTELMFANLGVVKKNLSFEFKEQALKQIVEGMIHIHKLGYAHRDLKLENIFYQPKPTYIIVKIGDFGISRIKHTNTAGTRLTTQRIKAPELIKDENVYDDKAPYGRSVDVYAFGILIFELLSNLQAFEQYNNHSQQFAEAVIKGIRPTTLVTVNIHKFWSDLMEECWNDDPTKRPTFENIQKRIIESH